MHVQRGCCFFSSAVGKTLCELRWTSSCSSIVIVNNVWVLDVEVRFIINNGIHIFLVFFRWSYCCLRACFFISCISLQHLHLRESDLNERQKQNEQPLYFIPCTTFRSLFLPPPSDSQLVYLGHTSEVSALQMNPIREHI